MTTPYRGGATGLGDKNASALGPVVRGQTGPRHVGANSKLDLRLGALVAQYGPASVQPDLAATASISINHSGFTNALTIIVAEPGRASPKYRALAAPAAATSSGRTR